MLQMADVAVMGLTIHGPVEVATVRDPSHMIEQM
jgi:hypothetical protein